MEAKLKSDPRIKIWEDKDEALRISNELSVDYDKLSPIDLHRASFEREFPEFRGNDTAFTKHMNKKYQGFDLDLAEANYGLDDYETVILNRDASGIRENGKRAQAELEAKLKVEPQDKGGDYFSEDKMLELANTFNAEIDSYKPEVDFSGIEIPETVGSILTPGEGFGDQVFDYFAKSNWSNPLLKQVDGKHVWDGKALSEYYHMKQVFAKLPQVVSELVKHNTSLQAKQNAEELAKRMAPSATNQPVQTGGGMKVTIV